MTEKQYCILTANIFIATGAICFALGATILGIVTGGVAGFWISSAVKAEAKKQTAAEKAEAIVEAALTLAFVLWLGLLMVSLVVPGRS